jgi:Skp family chaperone for outer membrane proteins
MAAVAALFVSCAAATASSAELKIGVVNVREVLARYKKHEDLQRKRVEHFKPRAEALQQRRRELAERVQRVQASLAESEQDPKRVRAVKQIETQEFILKLDYRELQRDMQKAADGITALVLQEVAAACRRIGAAQGYHLILKRYGQDPNAKGARQRVEAFQVDSLLYYAPELDITSGVLDLLEDAYRKGLKLAPDDDDLFGEAKAQG